MNRYLSALIALALVTFAAGCKLGDPSLPVYAPETAGIVVSASPTGGDGLVAFTLENGETANVDAHSWISGFSGTAGDLLLVGSSPQRWAYAVVNTQAGSASCFHIAAPTRDRGQSVDIQVSVETHDIYLRVPKASAFAGPMPFGVCLDGAGLAHSIPSQPS